MRTVIHLHSDIIGSFPIMLNQLYRLLLVQGGPPKPQVDAIELLISLMDPL